MYRRVGLVILAPYNGDLFQQRQNGFIVLFPVIGSSGKWRRGGSWGQSFKFQCCGEPTFVPRLGSVRRNTEI
jgi:hypothetical protein